MVLMREMVDVGVGVELGAMGAITTLRYSVYMHACRSAEKVCASVSYVTIQLPPTE